MVDFIRKNKRSANQAAGKSFTTAESASSNEHCTAKFLTTGSKIPLFQARITQIGVLTQLSKNDTLTKTTDGQLIIYHYRTGGQREYRVISTIFAN